MPAHRVAVIGGDGIGPEVIAHAVAAADRASGGAVAFTDFPWGTGYYQQHGRMLPADGWEILQGFDAVLFGAVGHPSVPDQITVHDLLLPMRRRFDQYVNLRPAYLFPGVRCPLAGKAPGAIDMLVFRENTEGEYAPVGGTLYPNSPDTVAVQTGVFTRRGCERILRAAFEAARVRPRKTLHSVTKSNAQVHSMGLWDEVYARVRADYPDVASSGILVDACAMDFVRKPEAFDVVVASNLFGDILTDLSAAVTGSIGLASSANINPTRQFPSMFEPVHGSAPDIAGRGVANPLAAVLSAGLMLDHLGLNDAAGRLRGAVAGVLADGTALTPDLGGTATTADVGAAVLAALG
jgi:tartrate dehydrogenase/decarboxylase/D-malate dehydrogenase